MLRPITIYCSDDSPRLRYVLQWLFAEQLGCDYIVTQDEMEIAKSGFFISYGKKMTNAICIPDTGLLWQNDIQPHDISTGSWQDVPTLYATDDSYSLPFDILSAIFFLLSRYEEYYTYVPDKHGRYPATDSILFKNGWLERPIVDEWVALLRKKISEQGNMQLPVPSFSYLPTYDIDIAYSYKHKGFERSVGGLIRDLLRADFKSVNTRLEVARDNAKDPYDSFELIQNLHSSYGYKPLYFILSALETTPFDKNIHPLHEEMQRLIKSFATEGEVGIHPSYYTNTKKYNWLAEKNTLEGVVGNKVTISRQHFVRMFLPSTYRHLLANGIATDYSMGYGTHLGFRCGSAQPFNWYDLQEEKQTELRVYPFCFMDSTAHYENKLSAADAFARLEKMTAQLQAVHSRLITVFHNFSLGNAPEWKDWDTHYSEFLEKMKRATSL